MYADLPSELFTPKITRQLPHRITRTRARYIFRLKCLLSDGGG